MLENLFSLPMILFYSLLYGINMKIADLLNEHGLKWFKGSNMLFGILWGCFGILLVLSNNAIANIILAMNIAFIVRNRLDYLNHKIAASMIILGFLLTSAINPILFAVFYVTFVLFGSVKDYVDDVLKKKNGILVSLNEAMLYYPISTLIYGLITNEWIVFLVFFTYTLSYDITKHIYKKKGYD